MSHNTTVEPSRADRLCGGRRQVHGREGYRQTKEEKTETSRRALAAGELDPEDVCPVKVRPVQSKVVLVDKVAAAKLPLYLMFNFALAFDSRRLRSVDVALNRP